MRVVTALICGIGIGSMLTAFAQSRALDPPAVAPHIFQVALDNERVRALKVTERHGETQPLHALADRVVVFLSNCSWFTESDDGARMDGYKFGDVLWRDAVTRGGETSNVIDACLTVEIELKE